MCDGRLEFHGDVALGARLVFFGSFVRDEVLYKPLFCDVGVHQGRQSDLLLTCERLGRHAGAIATEPVDSLAHP